MRTNNQMKYYDYAKTLSAEGVMTALIGGGGVGPEPEQHEYVDLGLPSGTLCNIGANSPEEAGLYFAWGETQGYTSGQVGTDKNFTWEDYKFGPDTAITKYNETDGLTVLEPEDDAATVNWGKGWKMPTREQIMELRTNTKSEWTTVNGVQGCKFTSKVDGYTDKFLFFPAAGGAANGIASDVGYVGCYWGASLYDNDYYQALRYFFYYGEPIYIIDTISRRDGYSVRPVRN